MFDKFLQIHNSYYASDTLKKILHTISNSYHFLTTLTILLNVYRLICTNQTLTNSNHFLQILPNDNNILQIRSYCKIIKCLTDSYKFITVIVTLTHSHKFLQNISNSFISYQLLQFFKWLQILIHLPIPIKSCKFFQMMIISKNLEALAKF